MFNILFISDFSANFPGAFIESLKELSLALKKLDIKCYYVFPKYHDYLDEFRNNGELIVLNNFKWKKFSLKLLIFTYSIVKKNKISIVHTNFGFCTFLTGSLLSFVSSAIHVSHERNTSRYYNKDVSCPRKILVKTTFKTLDYFCKNVYIAISNEVKNSLVNYNGISSDRIHIIHNAIKFKYSDLDNKKSSAKIVGMVAHMGPQKDHITLIDAAKIIISHNPEIKFVLIGDNVSSEFNYRIRIEKYIEKQNITKNFILTGELINPHKQIGLFTIGVLISNFEGFGNALLEYMQHKKPVIGTNIGGIKDIIIDGITGYLVPPVDPICLADKILFLLNHPEIAEAMGNRGYERALSEFNTDNWVNRILLFYKNVKIIPRKNWF